MPVCASAMNGREKATSRGANHILILRAGGKKDERIGVMGCKEETAAGLCRKTFEAEEDAARKKEGSADASSPHKQIPQGPKDDRSYLSERARNPESASTLSGTAPACKQLDAVQRQSYLGSSSFYSALTLRTHASPSRRSAKSREPAATAGRPPTSRPVDAERGIAKLYTKNA